MNAAGVAGAVVSAIVALPMPLLVVTATAQPSEPKACVPMFNGAGQPMSAPAPVPAAGLNEIQLGHAATIIRTGRELGIPERGIVIALATALQESRLRVYANDGSGALAPDQRGIAASLQLPHDAVGRDHGSLGIFQQQWPWWGTMSDLMDAAASAGKFYDALESVPRWEQLPVTVAAQAVQRSVYPDAYADDEPLARALVDQLGAGLGSVAGDCSSAALASPVSLVFPLPLAAAFVDQGNFGASGPHWSSRHTGTDLSVACGTPVLAATAGTIQLDDSQEWAGPWLVKISTGPGKLTTWYAHMRREDVSAGQTVVAGQQIGEVGDLGNATGCHLHFELHPRGGSIYEDPIDPSPWLEQVRNGSL